MENGNSKDWMGLHIAAHLEGDPHRLQERIAEAEQAMLQRRQTLDSHAWVEDLHERQALIEALDDLRALRERKSWRKSIASNASMDARARHTRGGSTG